MKRKRLYEVVFNVEPFPYSPKTVMADSFEQLAAEIIPLMKQELLEELPKGPFTPSVRVISIKEEERTAWVLDSPTKEGDA